MVIELITMTRVPMMRNILFTGSFAVNIAEKGAVKIPPIFFLRFSTIAHNTQIYALRQYEIYPVELILKILDAKRNFRLAILCFLSPKSDFT